MQWIKNTQALSILYVYYICTHTCIFLHSRLNYYIGFKLMKHKMTNKIHILKLICFVSRQWCQV